MGKKVEALKEFAVALGYGNLSDYTGNTFAMVLKQMAVKMECAPTVDDIRSNTTAGVLKFIADNYGSEEKEPYNLSKTTTHASVVIKRKGKVISTGTDILYNGDVLTITATPDTGYDLTTLTVNGTAFENGGKFTVNGHNVAIVATGTIQTFDLSREATDCTVTVTKGGDAVLDGEDVLDYGDTLTVTATVEEGYTLKTLTVNGEDIESGGTVTVSGDIEIVGTAEQD